MFPDHDLPKNHEQFHRRPCSEAQVSKKDPERDGQTRVLLTIASADNFPGRWPSVL